MREIQRAGIGHRQGETSNRVGHHTSGRPSGTDKTEPEWALMRWRTTQQITQQIIQITHSGTH